MGPIIIDITHHQTLIDAWNGSCVEEIEDFNFDEVAQSFFEETPGGHTPHGTKCIKETWINELPKVLFFSLNRVLYDRNKQTLVKNHRNF